MYSNEYFRSYDCTRVTHKSPSIMGARRNLMELICKEDEEDETVTVLLRIKPPDGVNRDYVSNLEILDKCTLLYKPSNGIPSSKCGRIRDESTRFTFNRIFGTETNQQQFYEESILPLIENVLHGRTCLLFAYGTTNAGKTHTILGSAAQPGIIPRTLCSLFSNIGGKLGRNSMKYKPNNVSEVVILNEKLIEIERRRTEFVMNCFSDMFQDKNDVNTQSYFTSSAQTDFMHFNSFKAMEAVLPRSAHNSQFDGLHYAVWVSFMEIYNEAIYDLLEPTTLHSKRTQLKLAYDKDSCSYVKGLQYICVRSAEEAYKVLMVGKKNLHMGATNLNVSSSRSHCIFTVKVVKYEDTDQPQYAGISSFTLCDLAGAERQKKTLNVGSRLRESQNINASLHVLGRCFETLRHNQTKKDNRIVPYRESKLTQIFQRAFDGKHSDRIMMIVNVNPTNQLIDETYHVLKASAVAVQLIPGVNIKQAKINRFSELMKCNPKGLISWKNTFSTPTKEQLDTISETPQTQELMEIIESLKDELQDERNKCASLEEQLRTELCDEFMKMMTASEDRWKTHMEQTEALHKTHANDMKEFYEERIEQYKEANAELYKLLDEQDDEVNNGERGEDEKLLHEIRQVKQSLMDVNLKNEFLSQEAEKHNLEIVNLKQMLHDKESFIEQRVQEMSATETKYKNQLKEKDSSIGNLYKLLDEAKDAYFALQEEMEMYKQKIMDAETENDEVIEAKNNVIEDLENRLEDVKSSLEKHLSENEHVLCKLENERDQLRNKVDQRDTQMKELTAELDTLKRNGGTMIKIEYEQLENDKITDLTTKLQQKEEECDRLKLEVRDVLSQYNENMKQQMDKTKLFANDDSTKQKLQEQVEQQKNEIDRLNEEIKACKSNEEITPELQNNECFNQEVEGMTAKFDHMVMDNQDEAPVTPYSSKGYTAKLGHMLMDNQDEAPVTPYSSKGYDLRHARSESKYKPVNCMEFMDENCPKSRKKVLKSAKKSRKKDALDDRSLRECNNGNNGRRNLFQDDFDDLSPMAAYNAEQKIDSIVTSPKSSSKSNLKKYKKRIN